MAKTPETPITFELDSDGLYRVYPGPGEQMDAEALAAFDQEQGKRHGTSSTLGEIQFDSFYRPITHGVGEHPQLTRDSNEAKAARASGLR